MNVVETWYTPQEMASLFKCSDETIRRWIVSGKIEAIRLGPTGDYRISEGAVREFLVPTSPLR
jgi:excisionase family DNA binding protein